MRSDDLSIEQARAIKNKLQPMLGYLNRLKKRMAHRGQTKFCDKEDAQNQPTKYSPRWIGCDRTFGRNHFEFWMYARSGQWSTQHEPIT